MPKNLRSTKWTFLIYKESAPENYQEILNELHIPYMLSPWHDKDINPKTGELKKAHKHGALYFERLKSYLQVKELLKPLKGPAHIEIVHSTKGMYDYFVHADNPDKAQYDIDEIESGCGFDLTEFLELQNSEEKINQIIELINDNELNEFSNLVNYVRENKSSLMKTLIDKTFFITKFIDSKRNQSNRHKIKR